MALPMSFVRPGMGSGRSESAGERTSGSCVRSPIRSPLHQKVGNGALFRLAPQRAHASRALGTLSRADHFAQRDHRITIEELRKVPLAGGGGGAGNEEARA